MAALTITAQEFARSQQARTEVRTIMTEGSSGGGVVNPILTPTQYDAVGSPAPDYNEAVALATIRAVMRLPVVLPSHSVGAPPSAADNEAALIYVIDESGGAVPAFSDGTDWRRVTDRAVIS